MKNWIWIIIGLIGLTILIYLSRDRNEIPHAKFVIDSTTLQMNGSGNPDADIPYQNYNPTNYRRQPSEDFLGKRFSVIMHMIYEWPDAQVYEVNTDGLTFMKFKVNNRHHELHFIDDSCVADYINRKP
ncbi:MAG: hypothetical protein ACK4K9_02065 [Bacteroidia bacterium]